MTDTAAAPEDRYVAGDYGPGEWGVIDRALGIPVGPRGLTWAATHIEAQRMNREARAANKPAAEPAAPSCDCTAENYRVALCKIARHSECRYARDIADEALAVADRMKGKGDAF